MNNVNSYPSVQRKHGRLPLVLIFCTTLVAIAISIVSLSSGFFIIFQNLLYIPIIFACFYYMERGFYYSVLLSCSYFFMVLAFSPDPDVILGAIIRVGIFVLVAAVITYISSLRLRVEEALRESESRYYSLFDNNYSASLLIDPETGEIMDVNDAACQYYGYSRDRFLEMKINDLNRFPEGTLIEHLKQGRNEGKRHLYSTHYLADGDERQVEIYSGPITMHGKTLIYAIIHDITNRIQAEQARRDSEERFRAIVEQSADVLFITGADGTIRYISPAAESIFGYAPDEMVHHHFTEFIDDAQIEKSISAFRSIVEESKDLRHLQIQMKRKDGSRFVGEVTGAPFQSSESSGTVGVIRDISDQKTAEEALKLTNKKLNLLSSITRHDILNQLTALRGYLGISQEIEKDPELAGYIEKASRAAEMIERQITFTRNYQDLGVQEPSWQDVEAAVKKAARELQAGDTCVTSSLDGFEVYADPLFGQVFYNLIQNALRYGGGKMTAIRISAHKSGSNLVLVCEDDGEGISPSERANLFKRGFGKNTGFGLFLSREILSITGITIEETSEPGMGARFEIVVPEKNYRKV